MMNEILIDVNKKIYRNYTGENTYNCKKCYFYKIVKKKLVLRTLMCVCSNCLEYQ